MAIPLPAMLRVLKRLDPGHERLHYQVLRTFNGPRAQRQCIRELLILVLFARTARTPWARRAGQELEAELSRSAIPAAPRAGA